MFYHKTSKPSKANEIELLKRNLEKSNIHYFENIAVNLSWRNFLRFYPSAINTCDIILGDNYLVVIPCQDFVFSDIKPIILSNSLDRHNEDFLHFTIYKPSRIVFYEDIALRKIDFFYCEPNRAYIKYELSLYNLDENTMEKLKILEDWN